MKSGYKDLIVWQKSVELVTQVYRLTGNFPQNETYGLISQMRRSAVSIPSNIAEWSKRNTKKDFNQFLAIALGSAAELETQLEIANRLGFGAKIDTHSIMKGLDEIMRMLYKLINN